jgi:hypothetical protein
MNSTAGVSADEEIHYSASRSLLIDSPEIAIEPIKDGLYK